MITTNLYFGRTGVLAERVMAWPTTSIGDYLDDPARVLPSGTPVQLLGDDGRNGVMIRDLSDSRFYVVDRHRLHLEAAL